MIIQSIKMFPFAGMANKEISFKKDLNVVLGKNEAGKSTIFQAIKHGFFTPSSLNKREFEEKMRKFIPLPHGDTAKLAIVFNIKGEKYHLEKTWGARPASMLTLPDQAIICDEKTIGQKLLSLLPTNPGAFKNVLMAEQGDLAKTVVNLNKKSSESMELLGDILKRSFLEADGISVDRFRNLIKRRFMDIFEHWDLELDRPQSKSGSQGSRWTRGVGELLKSYYQKEDDLLKYQKIKKQEGEIEKYSRRIHECTLKIKEQEDYLLRNKDIIKNARMLMVYKAQKGELQQKEKRLQELFNQWGRSSAELELLQVENEQLQKKIGDLEKDKEEAGKIREKQGLCEKFYRYKRNKSKVEQYWQDLQEVPKITDEDLSTIIRTKTLLDNLEQVMAFQKFRTRFTVFKDQQINFSKDLEDRKPVLLPKKGETLEFDAKGMMEIEHSDWKMEIYLLGEGEGNKIFDLERAKDNWKKVLQKFNISSLEEAKRIKEEYYKRSTRYQSMVKLLQEELEGEDPVKLEDQVKEIEEKLAAKNYQQIIDNFVYFTNKFQVNRKTILNNLKSIELWKKEYQGIENIVDVLAQNKSTIAELEQKIDRLRLLTREVDDLEIFVQEHERIEEQYNSNKERLVGLRLTQTELKSSLPEESSEELEKIFKESLDNFEKCRLKGRAVKRVHQEMEKILATIDDHVSREMENKLVEYLQKLSGGKYSRIKMKDNLPQGIALPDGPSLPVDWLSHGTKDLVALGVRMTMAGHFLKNKPAFLVMDDPLVDLDPERRKVVVEMVKDYAREGQVVIFTCHPEHARVWGSKNILELETV